MSKERDDKRMFLGRDKEGKTIVYQTKGSATIDKIFIEGSTQFADNDFVSALYRLGKINTWVCS